MSKLEQRLMRWSGLSALLCCLFRHKIHGTIAISTMIVSQEVRPTNCVELATYATADMGVAFFASLAMISDLEPPIHF